MSETKSTPKYAWVILAVSFIASVAAPLCMFKVTAIMSIVCEEYGLNLSQGGMLISAVSLAGVVLALPAGSIFEKLGLKATIALSMVYLFAGSLLGTFTKSFELLLVSRFFEGVGLALVSISAPAGIAMWFPSHRRGLAMGIWNMWMPIGVIMSFSFIPKIVSAGDYRSAWWATTIFAGVAFILTLIFVRAPRENEIYVPAPSDGASSDKLGSLKGAMLNKSNWLVFICAVAFGFCINIVPTFYPAFAEQQGVLSAAAVGGAISIQNVFGICWSLVTGFIFDRLTNRKIMFTWTFIVLAVLFGVLFNISSTVLLYCWLFAYAGFSGAIPTALYSCTPELAKKPQEIAYGIALLTIGQNIGQFAAPPIFGAIADNVSWQIAGWSLAPVLVIGALFGFAIKLQKRNKSNIH